jgi:hypothetical protein
MTAGLLASVRKLIAGDPASRAAADGVQTCEQLSQYLARIIGEIGVRTLLVRSTVLTSARFPWLASAIPSVASADSPWAALRVAMSHQDPDTASEALVGLLSTFIDLLGRLIGDALLAHLLHVLWPELFPPPTKGTP